jgi:hypothetical protein
MAFIRCCSFGIWYFGSKGLFCVCMILFLGFYEACIEIWEWGQEWLPLGSEQRLELFKVGNDHILSGFYQTSYGCFGSRSKGEM